MRRHIVAGAVAAASLAAAPTAGAIDWQWRDGGPLAAGARDAGASRDKFRASGAFADRAWFYIEVAAHYEGSWTLYGNWVRGSGQACHSYAGTMTLGGLVRNPHTVTQDPVVAVVRYDSDLPC